MNVLKRAITLVLVISTLYANAQNTTVQKEVNALFVGSKMTSNNAMISTLQAMINEKALNIKIDSIVYKNFNLSSHLEKMIVNEKPKYFATRNKSDSSEKTPTELKLQEKKWDIIILEPSFKRVLLNEARIFKVNKAIEKIKTLVDNPNCKFYIYGTTIPLVEYIVLGGYTGNMLDKSLEPNKVYKATGIGRFDKTMKTLNSKLNLLKEENNIEIINIGDFVYQIRKKHKDLELYDMDEEVFQEIYPSKNGAFLNACIFYKLLTGRSVVELDYRGILKKSKAKKIKKIVEENYR